ncbi:regulator of MON1-CCZ1 complex protein bulli [Tachypleus tridentatus]|uniref:regulator of MON1-CCZ1 complex protein bulli n=1 Tax=Tachypleus tridentatus TaxID=6853 RepID=UPI003FD17134
MDEERHFLELGLNPVRFEPVSKISNVFFDDANKQVFAVRSGGAMGVVVKGPDVKTSRNFRMEDKGDVISIKFSPDQKILAIQRCQKSVEFANFSDDIDVLEYSQSCKGKTTKVLGFIWTAINEVVFVTDHGIELYQVSPEKRTLKSLKTYNVPVNWFVYQPEITLLLLSSGTLGNMLHPFQFRPGSVYRLAKFEVDLPVIPKPPKLCLLERDVALATIYLKTCIIVLRHQSRGPGNTGAEIVIYTFQKDTPPRKTDILKLDMSGRFAVNVIDNLVLVHHQASKTSMIFDTRLSSESDGYFKYHRPFTSPHPIKPFKLKVPTVPSHSMSESAEVECELYSPNWIVFQPNIVIDAKLGCMWYVQIQLEPLVDRIADKCLLIDFLLLRKSSKDVILKVCRKGILPESQLPLVDLARIFDKLNRVYRAYAESEAAYQRVQGMVIDQSDMYTHVFSVFEERSDISYKLVVAVLIEYIRSLTQHQIPVQHYMYELLINTLVHHRCFYQLHQFLQYHILSDSKPLACLMLSLQSLYPPSHQLALDMLKRLGTANEEIIEVLLSKQQVLSALKFIQSTGNMDNISARKFLEAAMNTNDPAIYYAVFKCFEQRNIRLRGSAVFAKGEHCENFVNYFENIFGTRSSLSNFSGLT